MFPFCSSSLVFVCLSAHLAIFSFILVTEVFSVVIFTSLYLRMSVVFSLSPSVQCCVVLAVCSQALYSQCFQAYPELSCSVFPNPLSGFGLYIFFRFPCTCSSLIPAFSILDWGHPWTGTHNIGSSDHRVEKTKQNKKHPFHREVFWYLKNKQTIMSKHPLSDVPLGSF